jgi:hypothetical protein
MGFRLIKQLVFGFFFIGIILALIIFWFNSTKVEPTCSDGIENGEEDGPDCGLLACGQPCPPKLDDLEAEDMIYFKVDEDVYDIAFEVMNPNNEYGASRVRYDLILDGLAGRVYEKEHTFYILPGQSKYVIVPGVRTNGVVVNGRIRIKMVDWAGYNPVGTVAFALRSEEHVIGLNGPELKATIINQSDFDFNEVEVRVVLRNGDGDIIAVNATPLRTMLAKSERFFLMTWPNDIEGFIDARVDIESDTNLFENSNFVQMYGGEMGRFQKFY